jgi:hypothetical protein
MLVFLTYNVLCIDVTNKRLISHIAVFRDRTHEGTVPFFEGGDFSKRTLLTAKRRGLGGGGTGRNRP